MPTDRKQPLGDFVNWVKANVTGDEEGEAQIFLDRLFQALGHKGCLDVGGTPEFRIRKQKDSGGGVAFADYVWKPHVLIEMKKRGTDLAKHYRQAFDYWTRLVPGRPRYAILCNFDEFWVYDFETQMDVPVDTLRLEELPERWEPLAFLFPSHDRPVFENDHEQVTRAAADRLAVCFNKLLVRHIKRDEAQRFVLQMLVGLFAEDIDLLPRYFVARLLDECKSPVDSYDLLGGLFKAMNTPGGVTGGRFKGVDYFNGGLFEKPARLELQEDELVQLREAAKKDWSKVRPEIFGTLFQHSMEAEERHAYGGHFTTANDIMKIVRPTITQPWRDAIQKAAAGPRPVEKLEQLHNRMQRYRVLDPACGSGNFLYLAYRELKRLENDLFERLATVSRSKDKTQRLSFVTARQFFGLDINPFAVEMAKVTMMIARKLAIDELHMTEHALPLDNLDDNFFAGDALIHPLTKSGEQIPTMLFAELDENPWADGTVEPTNWPPADVIIGNPPFLGAKRLKPERGVDYVNAVRRTYPDVPGMADYCVFWFRKAHDHLPACTNEDPVAGRAGLVGTQNIRSNKSREGGLDHIAQTGTIVEAVDNQPWSGDAEVHVSIANWVKTQNSKLLPKHRRLWVEVDPPKEREKIRRASAVPAHKDYELAYRDGPFINSALSTDTDISHKQPLRCNRRPKRSFQGKILGYAGFLLNPSEALDIAENSADVVSPILTGRELLDDFQIRRWVIDFRNMSMREATRYPAAFEHCRRFVMPDVVQSYERALARKSEMATARKEHVNRWWQFWNRRDELNEVLARVSRYITCSRVTRRPVMVFLSSGICPSDALQVFAFEDDYSFGILQSNLHFEWFRKSSRLKVETDLRYSSRDVFETFPWPQCPSRQIVLSVALAARKLRSLRAEITTESAGGLRQAYRVLELPGTHALKDAHEDLDQCVRRAYGFSEGADILTTLLELNLDISKRETTGTAVTPPGIPPALLSPKELFSDDCSLPARYAPAP